MPVVQCGRIEEWAKRSSRQLDVGVSAHCIGATSKMDGMGKRARRIVGQHQSVIFFS